MTKVRTFWATGLFLSALLGCAAPVRIQPGLSAVRITVRAEPKAGYIAPNPAFGGADAYEGSGRTTRAEPGTKAFMRIDYRNLDDIIVWLEPQGTGGVVAVPPTATIDVSDAVPPNLRVHATGVGGTLRILNRGRASVVVYSLSEANEFDLGEIPPGGQADHPVASPGFIEVLTESHDDPVGQVYVAPTAWVGRARSRSQVTFTDLPPGPCRVACWHPRLPGTETTVDLLPDELTRMKLEVSVNALTRNR